MKEQFKNALFTGSINITLDQDQELYWSTSKQDILVAIKEVCEDFQQQGYSLTLRQLYYQLVAKDLIPNHIKVYAKLSSLKDDLVYSGIVDWSVFEDRGRIPKQAYYENSVKGALERTVDYYKLDRQIGQEKHIEVWTEKDAISDILSRVTDPYTIRLVINKGYSSSTAMYSAYTRFIESIKEGKKIVILYFGDHDPSGLDMVRDIRDRILFFLSEGERKKDVEYLVKWLEENIDICVKYSEDEQFQKKRGAERTYDLIKIFFDNHFEIKTIGLTMNQIIEFKPPHNPAKIKDPRANNYIKTFGKKSWEVDAITPVVMTEIVQNAIDLEMNIAAYQKVMNNESEGRSALKKMIDNINN